MSNEKIVINKEFLVYANKNEKEKHTNSRKMYDAVMILLNHIDFKKESQYWYSSSTTASYGSAFQIFFST